MDAQTAALVGQGITTLGVIFTAYFTYRSKRSAEIAEHTVKKTALVAETTAQKVEEVVQRVEDVHVATNGMKAELEAQKFIAGHAAGVAAEHERAEAEKKATST